MLILHPSQFYFITSFLTSNLNDDCWKGFGFFTSLVPVYSVLPILKYWQAVNLIFFTEDSNSSVKKLFMYFFYYIHPPNSFSSLLLN